MGNFHSCLNLLSTESEQSLAINDNFNMPSSIPQWPSGGGFAKGSIDLGGLEVRPVSTFNKIWSASRGGPENAGATFYSPSSIPNGFFALGSYAQPNSKPPFGRVLVAKDTTASAAALAEPTEYVLIWTSGDGGGYFWLPVAPSGYHPIGYLVTASPEKPSPDSLRCVRDDFTDQCEEGEAEVWSSFDTNSASGITVRGLVPSARGTRAAGIPPGAFIASTTAGAGGPSPVRCLKNKNSNLAAAAMPNLAQINVIIKAYSPVIYFHPDEAYLPSSVGWFFDNGALLYSKADPTGPTRIDSGGANLPKGGANDGAYWLDLPAADADKKRVKKGDLLTATAYVHVKPMLGGTVTDVVFWVFYPFNGPARAKVGLVNVGLGRIGEHVGDWEHVTVRVSNFNGELIMAYFSEHRGGRWVEAAGLEFVGGVKPAAYAALGGHAFYAKAGLVLQGSEELGIGIRNDAQKGKRSMDAGERFEVVAAEYLGEVVEPVWLQYMREWGLRVEYEVGKELEKVERVLPERWRKALRKVVEGLPAELLGEEGPTGPKVKASWDGDEV